MVGHPFRYEVRLLQDADLRVLNEVPIGNAELNGDRPWIAGECTDKAPTAVFSGQCTKLQIVH
ncbi:hypothetical protein D9M68_985320 [compost metagenome]